MNIQDKTEIMKKLGRTTRRLLADRPARGHENLGRGQMGILDIIFDNPGISQEEIANQLDLDKTTVAKAVKKMEMHGMITRKKSEEDGRKFEIYADEKAGKMKENMKRHREQRCGQAFEGIDDAELNAFSLTLDKIENNIDKNNLDMRKRRLDVVKKAIDEITANPGISKEDLKASLQLEDGRFERLLNGLTERGIVEAENDGYYATEKSKNMEMNPRMHKERMHKKGMHPRMRRGK